jgi:uncharacterized membrane protein
MKEPEKSTKEDDDEDEIDDELHEAERIIAFTDATVAIAMTLLILPLMEKASELYEVEGEVEGEAAEGSPVVVFFNENHHQTVAFITAFTYVASAWMGHAAVYKYVGRFNDWMILLNFLWMLAVVFNPVSSALLKYDSNDKIQIAVFIVPFLVCHFVALLTVLVVQQDPRVWKGSKGPGNYYVVAFSLWFTLILVAGLIQFFVESAHGSWAWFIIFLAPLVRKILQCVRPEWMQRHHSISQS